MSDALSPRSPSRKKRDKSSPSAEARKRSRSDVDDGYNDKEKTNRGDKRESKSHKDHRRHRDGDRDRDMNRDRERRRDKDRSRERDRNKHDRNRDKERDRDRRRRDGSEETEAKEENQGREQRRRDRERDKRRQDEEGGDELDTKMSDEPVIFMNREREKMIEKQNEQERKRQRRERFKEGASREDRQDQPKYQPESSPQSRSPRRGSPDRLENSLDNGEIPAEKEKPNLNRTHHLVAETNTVNGTVLKHVEPSDARLPPPRDRWKMYVFKGDAHLEDIALDSRSCWLFGRDRSVADLPVDHPSCSGQHAALQFRFVSSSNEWGEKSGAVKPYVIDLKSANSTYVNGDKIPSERYYELRSKDLVKFGLSTREYILMLEK